MQKQCVGKNAVHLSFCFTRYKLEYFFISFFYVKPYN